MPGLSMCEREELYTGHVSRVCEMEKLYTGHLSPCLRGKLYSGHLSPCVRRRNYGALEFARRLQKKSIVQIN